MSMLALADVKTYLRVENTVENTMIQMIIDAMESWVAEMCAIKFVEAAGQEASETYADGGDINLRVKYHPITALTKITDRTDDGEYDLTDVYFNESRIWKDGEERWESGNDRWKVEYDAGYTTTTLPSGLKLVMHDCIFRAYNNRGGKKAEAFEGVRIDWQAIDDAGDLMRKLQPYSFREVIG